jgi:site-specific recombinase XerD
MNHQTFTELLESYNAALEAYGAGLCKRLDKLQRATVIIRRHEALGKNEIDESVVADYMHEISTRFHAGEIGEGHTRTMRRATEQFLLFVKTGDVNLPNPLLGARTVLSPEFRKIVEDFLRSEPALIGVGGKALKANTRNDIRWVAHKYFEWLTEQGYSDLSGVGAEQIQKFILHCSETMAMGSVHNIRLFMLKLYAYLYMSGLSPSSFAALLSFKVNRDKKIAETRTADELAAMLKSIDRTKIEGKRAYAVMMLGIVLGIRACDVVALKLADIDWINGELRILQAKTAFSVVLPLTKDVGEALSDYILNARPPSNSEQVFLRLNAPYTGLKSAVTIGEIYESCCKAAGLSRNKRFHTLRRSLGTSMLSSGTPVNVVAQVLGHAEVESTKKYIAVDKEHLKICSRRWRTDEENNDYKVRDGCFIQCHS